MPPVGRPSPPDSIPASGGRNGDLHPVNTGTYLDDYHSQSPTDAMAGNSGTPWRNGPSNGGSYDSNVLQSADSRVGRQQESGHSSRDRSTPRDRSRPNGGAGAKSPGNSPRTCKKCGETLLGQFVRALGGTFHLECFQCNVSDKDLR